MQKKLLLLLAATFIFLLSFSQSISPDENTEFCPLTDITFTVTLPRITDNTTPTVSSWTNTPILVSGVSNLINTPTQTTFTFVGRFMDVNLNQVFRVTYQTSTNANGVKDFQFKRIKSLFYSTTCAYVPNQTAITVPRCQVVNIPVSVSNVQWGTFGETPALCFGSINTFEYQLPNGWSIGADLSIGSNWIAGGNNVTVTSDLSNGEGGAILIRPRNNCGGGLAIGETPAQILISRPAPNLTITGSQDYICNSSCATYTINGLPSGATVQWSLSNLSEAAISGCSTCPTVTVCKTGSGNTLVTLTATVTHCSPFVYNIPYEISLGKPKPNPIVEVLIDPFVGKIQVESTPALPGATYNWYKDGVQVIGQHGSAATIPIRRNVCAVGYGIEAEAINGCGTSAKTYKGVYVPPCDEYYSASPNPAISEVIVTTKENNRHADNKPIEQLLIYDFQGNLKKKQRFSKVKTAILNISQLPNGTYYLEIISGAYRERIQLLIHK